MDYKKHIYKFVVSFVSPFVVMVPIYAAFRIASDFLLDEPEYTLDCVSSSETEDLLNIYRFDHCEWLGTSISYYKNLTDSNPRILKDEDGDGNVDAIQLGQIVYNRSERNERFFREADAKWDELCEILECRDVLNEWHLWKVRNKGANDDESLDLLIDKL